MAVTGLQQEGRAIVALILKILEHNPNNNKVPGAERCNTLRLPEYVLANLAKVQDALPRDALKKILAFAPGTDDQGRTCWELHSETEMWSAGYMLYPVTPGVEVVCDIDTDDIVVVEMLEQEGGGVYWYVWGVKTPLKYRTVRNSLLSR